MSNRHYVESLEASGVLATEMEASLLFVLAAVASAGAAPPLSAGPSKVLVASACVLAIYGEAGSEASLLADQRAISVACEGVLAWARQDGQGGISEQL